MYLKEAFRYQNYLTTIRNELVMRLSNRDCLMNIKQEHMKKDANPSATNETIESKPPMGISAQVMVDMLTKIGNEQLALLDAISKAKRDADIDMDTEIAKNRIRQDVCLRMKSIVGMKKTERTFMERAFMINAEGNQTDYAYQVNETATPAFDQKAVRDEMKELSAQADDSSAKIDRLMATCEVDFNPSFSVNDSLIDILLDEAEG